MSGRVSNRALALICTAEVLGLANYSGVPALLPEFMALFGLSNTGGGWLTGIFFAGYTLAVLVLVTLTDRVPARTIYLASMALTAAACAGFALADSFWWALLMRALAGIGLAGTYMPGLKALSDRASGVRRARIIAWYTSSFVIGVGASFILIGESAALLGWRGAFWISATCAAAAMLIAWLVLPAERRPEPAASLAASFNLTPVLRNRQVMAFVLAYAAIVWGTAGVRGWLVVFLDHGAALQPPGVWAGGVFAIAAIASILGVPAGVLGNELGIRYGLRRAAVLIFLVSAGCSCLFGFAAALSWPWVVALTLLYAFIIQGNISNLTTGTVAAAEPARMGASMALHSFIGFCGGVAGPLAFGVILDLAGGTASITAWVLAFAGAGAGLLAGAVSLLVLGRARPRR